MYPPSLAMGAFRSTSLRMASLFWVSTRLSMGRRENLHLIAEDLGERELVDVLNANRSWDRAKQTVIVAEGLLMYLPPPAPLELFAQCAQISGDGSRMAFTYIGTRTDGRADAGWWTWLVLWILKANGEPWLWSIQPEELNGFLRATGWTCAPDLERESPKYGVEFFGVAIK